MTVLRAGVVVARVVFRPLRRIRLDVWSGVFAGKLVYDAFTRSGCVVDRGGFFRVTPVEAVEGGSLVGGWLVPGRSYQFTVYVWGPGRQDYVSCLAEGLGLIGAGIELLELSISEREARIELPGPSGDDEPAAVVYGVRHLPTFYRFHGATIAYPSPRRLIASISRRIVEASGASEEDAKTLYELALALAEHVELYRDETRRQRIRISHGKDQPVFHGYAEYYVIAEKPLIHLLHQLLEAAKLLGLGGSPGLGLGHVASVKTLQPRHQPPPSTQKSPTSEDDVLPGWWSQR